MDRDDMPWWYEDDIIPLDDIDTSEFHQLVDDDDTDHDAQLCWLYELAADEDNYDDEDDSEPDYDDADRRLADWMAPDCPELGEDFSEGVN